MFAIFVAYFLLINNFIVAKAECVITANTFEFNHHQTDYSGWRCPTECRSAVLSAARKYFSDTFNVQTTITREITDQMDEATGSCDLATLTCSGGVSVSEKTDTEVTVIYRDVTWAASLGGDVNVLDCQEGEKCAKCSCPFFERNCGCCGRESRHCNGDYIGQVTFTAVALPSCTAPTPHPTPMPSPHPTPLPTPMPSLHPTPLPTPMPSHHPTPMPSFLPTPLPTTPDPTTYPSKEPMINEIVDQNLGSSIASKGRVLNLLILGVLVAAFLAII